MGSVWAAAIAAWVLALALVIGLSIDAPVGLPGRSTDVIVHGLASAAGAAVLTIAWLSLTLVGAGCRQT